MSRLDEIQRNIWARINKEAQARGIKWKTGDAYCLGSVIKEVLHPSVQALIDSEVAKARLDELEKLEANSDCLEDGCGLDAELLRDNLLRRIPELKADIESNKEGVE